MRCRLFSLPLLSFLLANAQAPQAISPLATAGYAQQAISLLVLPTHPAFSVVGFTVHTNYDDDSPSQNVQLSFQKNGQTTFVTLENLSNPNGFLVVAPDQRAFVINWSDGGGLGNWHAKLFFVDHDHLREASQGLRLIAQTFKLRHFCKVRGNNLTAVRWLDNHRMLVETEVYPTSDCGPDLGYTDRFVLNTATEKIETQVHVPECVIEGHYGKAHCH